MHYFLLSVLLVVGQFVHASDIDTTVQQVTKLPDKYLSQVEHKSHHVEEQVNKCTEKALARFVKQEKRMWAKLWGEYHGLYDFLASRSISPTSALKVRMGYNF